MSEDLPDDLSNEALRFVVRLHSGEATKADAAAFAEWRARSAAHEEAAREAESIWGDASDLHEDEATRTVQPGRKSSRKPGGKLFGIALILALAGGAAVWRSGALRPWTADATTGLGETRTLTLADGSRVVLNARSAIDIAFTPGERHIDLIEGEAFFEVAADRTRPFVVAAQGLAVTARGTAFDVDRRDGETAVAVSEHAVRVASDDGTPVDLAAGEELVMDAAGHVGAVRAIARDDIATWRTGLLVAEDRPLTEIVGALRPYHRGWIVLRDPELARLRVNAVLDLKTPERALRTLEKGLPIRVSTLSPFVILVAPR